jgi:hypothetical protein
MINKEEADGIHLKVRRRAHHHLSNMWRISSDGKSVYYRTLAAIERAVIAQSV